MNNRPIYTMPFARKVVAQLLLVPVLFLSLSTSVGAQSADELAKQQMEIMKQYMEAAGMSAEDIAKNEALARSSMAPIVEAQAAQEAQEQAKFEATHAGRGKAVISMGGNEVELQITECVSKDNGDWYVKAQDRANRSSTLSISGDTHYRRSILWMNLKDVGAVEDIWIEPMVPMKDGRVAWAGTADGGRGETRISVNIECGQAS